MAKIICPECNKIISSYADMCPDCGFPVKKYLTENHLDIINKACICPKCAMTYGGYKEDNINLEPLNIKCRFCNCTLICTDFTSDEIMKKCHENYSLDFVIDIAKEYGNNQFSEDAYQHRLDVIKDENIKSKRKLEVKSTTQQSTTPQPSTPHCPVCNSTNIEKISLGKKAKGSLLFGIFSSDVRKQMHCKDCGYKF